MSETKFTPGPWRLNAYRSIISESDYIATINTVPDGATANSHLIAAAPELYELLAEYVHTMSQTKMASLDYHMQFNYRAHDLLAKARGESNG